MQAKRERQRRKKEAAEELRRLSRTSHCREKKGGKRRRKQMYTECTNCDKERMPGVYGKFKEVGEKWVERLCG